MDLKDCKQPDSPADNPLRLAAIIIIAEIVIYVMFSIVNYTL